MKIFDKKFFTVSLSIFTIFTSSFDTFAMEQKPEMLPITVSNSAALSTLKFNIDKTSENPTCCICLNPIEKNCTGSFVGCGEQIFKSASPKETFEQIKNHMMHSKCANELKLCMYLNRKPFICQLCKNANVQKTFTDVYFVSKYFPVYKMKMVSEKDNNDIDFEINSFYQLLCCKCYRMFKQGEPIYYFGCGKDIYDGFSQAKSCRLEQDKLEKNFDTKLKLNKMCSHGVCSDCAKKIEQCPSKNCPARNINWKGYIKCIEKIKV